MRHGLIRVWLAFALGTLVIAAACGGDDDGGTRSPSETVQPSVTRTPAAATPSPTSELSSSPPCPLAEPQPFPTMFPSVPPLGGGDEITPPTYQEAQLVVQGVSISRQLTEEEAQRLLGAIEAVRMKASGDGEEINCIRVFGSYDDYSQFNDVCGGDKLGEFREFGGMTFDYLPPQTYAMSPLYAAICPNGSVSGFGREFVTCCDPFTVWFVPGPRGFAGGGVRGGQVYGATLSERPAVILLGAQQRPLRQIAMATATGTIIITAGGLPLDEAVNVAMGIRCDEC